MGDQPSDQSVVYGLYLMQQATGVDLGAPRSSPLEPFEGLLGRWPPHDPDAPLRSIFSRVHLPDDQTDDRRAPPAYLRPQPLQMNPSVVFPTPTVPASLANDRQETGAQFQQAYERLRQALGPDDPHFLIAFHHLMERFAWALPNTVGEPGVGLFYQWKTVTALWVASGKGERPAKEFLLVGGDIPGIQQTLYTITARGAAKGLRGRSLFIQLLGDAVSQRILDELGLYPANRIAAAGGNFMLLAPAGEETEASLKRLREEINKTLLETFHGDLAICLAWVSLPADAVGTCEFGGTYARHLHQAIARRKAQRFGEILDLPDGYDRLFRPTGEGGERGGFCAVCQRELTADEKKDPNLLLRDVGEREVGEEAPRMCADCATFRDLAEAVGHPQRALFLGPRPPGGGERWQEILHRLSGRWVRFAPWTTPARPGETKILLNETDFLSYNAHGFRFLANTTPRVSAADVKWWRARYGDSAEVWEGSIRTFEMMAHDAAADGAVERVGILRMDVDDLGKIVTRGLAHNGEPCPTMAATAALSAELDRFFAGYLDRLCREVSEAPGMGLPEHPGEERIYVIYAGGDDLFIVGPWHLLPILARRVQGAFTDYVGRNPFLHISGAVTLERRKFPLYRAAERAAEALEQGAKARRYTEDGRVRRKNGFWFLGQTVGWDELAEAQGWVEQLVRHIRADEIPRGLLTRLQAIHERFRADHAGNVQKGLRKDQVLYGPWMWQQAYHLARLAEGKPPEIQEMLSQLRAWTMDGRIRLLGLVARWAELLTRKKEEEQ